VEADCIILEKLKLKGVYHTGIVPPEAKPLPENWLVRNVGTANLLIGHFQDKSGFQYLMFVNKDTEKPVKANAQMDPQAVPLKQVGHTGASRFDLLPIASDYKVCIELDPGKGKLYKIDRWNDSPPWLVNPKTKGQTTPQPYHPDHQAQPGM
jgi:hypothetical protein